MFLISITLLVVCIAVTLIVAKEEPLLHKPENLRNPFVQLFKGILNMPKAMKRVCLVQFFTWYGIYFDIFDNELKDQTKFSIQIPKQILI